MKFNLENGLLIVFVDGKIDSTNASQFEEEILQILSKEHERLIIDVENLVYISSAGLRVFLKIGKQEKNFEVINASLEVYEIFEMTGFSSLFKISKALRKISLDGATLIGSGYFSKVYRLNKDTLVKVFINIDDINEIKRELALCREAFILGVPTSISFDVVKVDDRYGVVFEMLDFDSFRDTIVKNPENLSHYIRQYADLLLKINHIDAGNFDIPDSKKLHLDKVETVKEHITEEEYSKLKSLIEALPNSHTLIHGDCHIKNIMYDKNELQLIDMDTLSFGYPIFELSGIYAAYQGFEETDPGNLVSFMGVPFEVGYSLFYDTMKLYFKNVTDEEFNDNVTKIQLVCYLHMMYWTVKYEGLDPHRFDVCYKGLKRTLKDIDTLELKGI